MIATAVACRVTLGDRGIDRRDDFTPVMPT
jgi:hypothetical protein